MPTQSLKANYSIFATGVELQPVECVINGIKQFRWVAVNFQDDSFLNGEIVIPIEFADNLKDLLIDE